MRTFFHPDQFLHNPKFELSDGKLVPAVEIPKRAESVIDQVKLQKLGSIEQPQDFGLDPILRIHKENYVEFLENFWNRWLDEGRKEEAFPFVWPVRGFRTDKIPTHIDGQLGYFSFDAGTPIGENTYKSARSSANTALAGAQAVSKGEASAFALCRPPGHHAAEDYYGGYCFFNNAAIASQFLRDHGANRVSILDIDYHHGNGTQSIFYDRSDIQFISIHADSKDEFPYFLGAKDETGNGEGYGFTVNYPLPKGTGWPDWSIALDDALVHVEKFKPDALIVSLGLDVFENDPISHFCLKTSDFKLIGARLQSVDMPTLFILEGGYAVSEIGLNCLNVLSAFES